MDGQEMKDNKVKKSAARPPRKSGRGRTAALSEERRDQLNRYLHRQLARDSKSGPKHQRLQTAVVAAISEGVLTAGDQLPSEPEIATGVGLSLGTVRRCLTQLANDGVVSREHGRGTFISGVTLTENEVWHMRFLEDDLVTVRPIYQRILGREILRETGSWSEHLGQSEEGYVRVRRAVNVDSLFVCHSDFYLRGDHYSRVLDLDPHEIESVGLKHVLRLYFNVSITRVQKISQILPTPDDVTSVIGVQPGHPAQRVEIRGFAHDNQPVSYQVIWIPPTAVPLDLSGPVSMPSAVKA